MALPFVFQVCILSGVSPLDIFLAIIGGAKANTSGSRECSTVPDLDLP